MKEPAVPASEFKAKCLRRQDEVAKKHRTVLITKHERPVARLVPVAEESARLRDT
jgi:prevent-host-death family protein